MWIMIRIMIVPGAERNGKESAVERIFRGRFSEEHYQN